MSHKRLFPDDQRERLRREAMELASALIAQIVMVLQMPEPPGAAALRQMMRTALAHGEAVARRIIWMLAAHLAARRPLPPAAAPRPNGSRRAASPTQSVSRPARQAARQRAFRLTEPCRAPKAAAKAAPQPGHAPAGPRAAPDPARLRDELNARLETLIRVLNNPEPEALRLLARRARLAAPARAALTPAIPGFEPRVPEWQRTLAHLCRRALAARQKIIDTS